MALQLKHPAEVTKIFTELDPSGEFRASFRQATARDVQIRDTLVFGPQQRILAADGLSIRDAVAFSVRQEVECRLTMTSCVGLLREDGSPVFRFKRGKLNMDDQEFHDAWGLLFPQEVVDALHNACLDANPDWDWRDRPDVEDGDEENPPQAGVPETG